MARINRNRLHLLLSSLCGLAGVAFGIFAVMGAFSSFSDTYINTEQIRDLERRTGMTYAQWRVAQDVQCAREMAGRKVTSEQIEYDYHVCMLMPVTVPISAREALPSFLTTKGPGVVLYAAVVLVGSWLLGFLVVKGIPRGARRFWRWLTVDEKTT